MTLPLVRALACRVLGALLGASGGAVVSAMLDARAATSVSAGAFAPAFLASLGLVAPLSLGVGLGVGVALCLLLPEGAAKQVLQWLRPVEQAERSERAFLLVLAPAAGALWLVVLARWAVVVLASELAAGAAGATLAAAALLLGVVLALGARTLAPVFAARFRFSPDPLAVGLTSLGAALLFVFVAIVTGAPSGAGGPLSLLGVLTRDELDLRPVGLVFIVALAASFAPRARSRVHCAAALLAPLGLLALTARAASALDAPGLALAIERGAPLGAPMLRLMRKLTDRDHDGYAARFGGGDCDDHAPSVNPGAEDIPQNQIDEDCSGSDAAAVVAAAPKAASNSANSDNLLAKLPERLNVVLLTVDTLRADLGYLGNPRPLSPALDALAKESVVYENAYSLASYTAKSLPPMLIGRYSSETHRGFLHFNRFEKSDRFVAERLQRAGVRTVSVQGHWYFFQNYGMERGFDRINNAAAPRAAQAAEGDRSVTSEQLSDEVLKELDDPELVGKPFFLWAHYTDPHAEYVPHAGFEFGSGSRAAYDGEVAFVDRHVGRVLAGLRQKPYWSNTVVIVTSDHGEAFGEHSMIRHGFELWEELVRVPLLLRIPGVEPRRISVRRGAIDLVPTMLELMRIPADGELSGTSLLADVATNETKPSPRPVFIDMAEGPHNAERRALIDGDQKLVVSGGRALGLYDLAKDPAEKHDLSSDKALAGAALERYRAFRRALREVYVRPTR